MFASWRRFRWAAVVGLAVLLLPAVADAADVSLIDAAKEGDVETVRGLLPQVDVNEAQVDGTTALHWAVHLDNVTLVDLLIASGAAVQATNRYGMTPLALAAINGNAVVIERLLEAGANANDSITEGETALMTAARSDRVEAVATLLAHGADANARETFRGQTALMWRRPAGTWPCSKHCLRPGRTFTRRPPRSTASIRC